MDYEEAKKLVAKSTKKENYLRITLTYGNSIVMPYKDGIQFLNSLASAEKYVEEWDSNVRKTNNKIVALNKDVFGITILSSAEYEKIKIAQLLGVSVDDLPES